MEVFKNELGIIRIDMLDTHLTTRYISNETTR